MELKPCPFCGNKECETYTNEEVSFVQNQDLTMSEEMRYPLWGACCYECSAQVYGFDTEEEAIEAWNTRAERTCRMTKKGHEFVLAGWWECSECGPVYPPCNDEIAVWALQKCPRCGAKVVE